MNQTFAGFIRNNLHLAPVRAVNLYINDTRKDTRSSVLERIDSAHKAGKIDGAYRVTLRGYVEACWSVYDKSSKLVDVRDPKDWHSVGGGRMRKTHIEPDNSGVVDPGFGQRPCLCG